LDLVSREVRHESGWTLLHRDRRDPPCLVERGRHAVLDEAKERLDRGEPRIAGRDPVLAGDLQVTEERHHQIGIEVLERELGGGDPATTARESQQELKRI
jgi:hypothetical protein